ncbi:ATP synthase subunit I [Methylophaga sulfidovorans]|uniref:ATP synthase I chain n=1 Tax=Methylophaga sulfidovorans TaxID=45496 RepID=A0A1I3W8L8_9GAMM|nr:ATP synthase subunit I [Methylophaga sulfidovorans]SFK03017.1 ATP synthase I chain [Methylophaga sulfidovorans]
MDELTRLQPLKKMLWMQVSVCLLAIVLITICVGYDIGLAVGFGCLIAIMNTLLLIWHILRAAETAKADAKKNLIRAYRCVAERWLNTGIMFVVGIFLLKLNVPAVMAGFIAAQLVLFMTNTNRA